MDFEKKYIDMKKIVSNFTLIALCKWLCVVWCIEFTTETKYKFVAVPSKKYMEL